MRVLVLGGAGKMGCISVQDLAKDERVEEIIIADVNIEQAKVVADYLDSPKIGIQMVDINDEDNFLKTLAGRRCLFECHSLLHQLASDGSLSESGGALHGYGWLIPRYEETA